MTADHWVGQVEIFDHRLQFTLVLFGHFAPEDRSDLVGLPDVSIQIQQPLGDFIYRCPAMEDEVVAILHLRKEKTMLASGLLAFLVRDERGERCQPFLTTLQQVPRGERVGEFLQATDGYTSGRRWYTAENRFPLPACESPASGAG